MMNDIFIWLFATPGHESSGSAQIFLVVLFLFYLGLLIEHTPSLHARFWHLNPLRGYVKLARVLYIPCLLLWIVDYYIV